MEDVLIAVDGMDVDFATCREVAAVLARRENKETMLVAWSDRDKGNHSPSCVKCSIGEESGWEVYGRNHGGRLRVSINNDEYVFIHT